MLELNKGTDIVIEIGGIETSEAAMKVFEDKLDKENLAKIRQIRTPDVLLKIANSIAMCRPDSVFINTGSEADRQYIRELVLKNGEERSLALKGHTIHFDLKGRAGAHNGPHLLYRE